MKIRKLVAAVLSALIFATSIVTPSTLPGFNIVSEAATKLKAPEIISKTSTINTVQLKWKPVSGADGFLLYYYSSSSKKYKLVKAVTTTSYIFTGLSSGTTYKFKVAAYVSKNDKKVAQTFTDVIKVTTKKLSAPSSIRTSSENDSITLSWNKVSGADAYRVYVYNKSTGKYKTYKNVSSTSCKVSGLEEGTTYKFKVSALVKKGSSYKAQKASSAVSAKTTAKSALNTPDFNFYDGDGNKFKLSDYAGKPIIINIWATWCGPCIKELPSFNKLYKQYGDDVQFIMLNCESRSEVDYVELFTMLNGYEFPVFYDFDYDASGKYGEGYIPLTIVIDEDGNLVTTHTGSMTESQILALIKKVL